MISATHAPATSFLSKAIRTGLAPTGLLKMRSVASVTTPQVDTVLPVDLQATGRLPTANELDDRIRATGGVQRARQPDANRVP